MKKQKEKRYRLTMTEKQLHYMMAAVEDWHRFLCGQCELSNATAYADERHDAREALQKHVRPYIVPELPDPRLSYGWSDGAAVETRQFSQVPIKAGYITTYSGNFFITFDTDFTFVVGDWGELDSQTF